MRLCRIVGPNFAAYPFVSTSSRTLTIESQSGKTATVAVVGTVGLKCIYLLSIFLNIRVKFGEQYNFFHREKFLNFIFNLNGAL